MSNLYLIGLAGIMFDSPFLSDGSKPLRGTILTYVSLVIIAMSLLYFISALAWEIKTSRKKKKTKRQIMWSKLKGFKHRIVEDSRSKAKEEKLNRLFNKTKIKTNAAGNKFNKSFNVKQIKKLNEKFGSQRIEPEKIQHHHHYHHHHRHNVDILTGKNEKRSLLPDLSGSSSDLEAYTNSSRSEMDSSSSSEASSSPLSSSESSKYSVGDGSSNNDFNSSENLSFASDSDTLERVLDTSTFVMGSQTVEDNDEKSTKNGKAEFNSSNYSSSSTGSISDSSSTDSSSIDIRKQSGKKIVKIPMKSDLRIAKPDIEVEEDVLSIQSINEEIDGLGDDANIEDKIKKLSLVSTLKPKKNMNISSSETDDSSSIMSDSSSEKKRKSNKILKKKEIESDSSGVDVIE
jgi:hypothetical protein